MSLHQFLIHYCYFHRDLSPELRTQLITCLHNDYVVKKLIFFCASGAYHTTFIPFLKCLSSVVRRAVVNFPNSRRIKISHPASEFSASKTTSGSRVSLAQLLLSVFRDFFFVAPVHLKSSSFNRCTRRRWRHFKRE